MVLHTTYVKSTNPGGRLYDGIHATEVRKNGEFGFLGEYAGQTEGLVDGQTQVRKFEKPTGGALNTKMPVVIMQPEMMYDNSRQSLLKLSNWEIEPKTAFCCVPLQSGDKFDVSVDALAGHNNGTDLAVGKCYELKANQTTLGLTTGGNPPANGRVYFQIVKVKDAHARSARINGAFANDNYKLYTMEVRVK